MDIRSRDTNQLTSTGFVAVEIVGKGLDKGLLCVNTVETVAMYSQSYKVLSWAYPTKGEAEAYLDGIYESRKK